jgi:hypothetical protein
MTTSWAAPVAATLIGVAPVHADVNALVDAMIAAHGGYERWAAAPSVSFVDEWSDGQGFRTTVEQGRRRAYLEADGGAVRVAWDGAECRSVGWPEQGPPPRFLALLNWYFLNLPWIVRDPGVRLEPGMGTLHDDATEYLTLRLTYDEGVGDTPRDWYELYIHPRTRRLAACRYVVTYRALLPEGVAATPPHVLRYDEWATVDGLVVPTRFTIREEDGAVYASCTISEWSFRKPFDETRLNLGPAAVVDRSTP